ncbi:Uncharacterized protein Fot_41249 [Forsythia ovata]|uniref:Uncharacterized protein n=1 Tax=Forsythia ovata TaxID=205694 RepID=A0ABD1RJ54_9LAMI
MEMVGERGGRRKEICSIPSDPPVLPPMSTNSYHISATTSPIRNTHIWTWQYKHQMATHFYGGVHTFQKPKIPKWQPPHYRRSRSTLLKIYEAKILTFRSPRNQNHSTGFKMPRLEDIGEMAARLA